MWHCHAMFDHIKAFETIGNQTIFKFGYFSARCIRVRLPMHRLIDYYLSNGKLDILRIISAEYRIYKCHSTTRSKVRKTLWAIKESN